MNDFEKFETELNELYTNYVLKFRILSYLEKELEGHFRNQREKVQVSLHCSEDHRLSIRVCVCASGSISAIHAIDELATDRTGSAEIQ